jgi:hypothetical protein
MTWPDFFIGLSTGFALGMSVTVWILKLAMHLDMKDQP